MRGIRYFNLLSKKSHLVEREVVDSSEQDLPLADLEYWKTLTGNPDIDSECIQIIIPYHNSPHLEKTVDSLINQQTIPSEIKKNLVIVASACTDESIQKAQTICKDYQRDDFTINLIIQNEPGKPTALNTGLDHFKHDIVIQSVDDIVVSKYFVSLMYLALLLNPERGATVAVGYPSNLNQDSLLFKIQQLHFDKFGKFEEYALMGRGFAFRKSLIPYGFPEHVMSEDFWLELQVREKSEGIIVVDHCHLEYQKPTTWSDYLKQVDRFDGSFKQLKSEFKDLFNKHFGEVNNTFISMLGIEGKGPLGTLRNYLFDSKYDLSTKLGYIGIIFYQLYYLGLKNRLRPVRKAAFSREESTLES